MHVQDVIHHLHHHHHHRNTSTISTPTTNATILTADLQTAKDKRKTQGITRRQTTFQTFYRIYAHLY